jgi:hypothetical protein
MVYFTPWNTIEIWNESDFEDLQRVWFSQANNHDERIFIHKDSLPVSDLTDAEFFNDSIPKSYYSPQGLGYMIPVHYIEDDEGQSEMRGRRADGCGSSKKRWIGQVSGRIRARVNSDLQNIDNVDINISGIKVVLWQREGSFSRSDKRLGVGFTDLDGRFVVNVDKCIRNSVGDNIELFVVVESVNQGESIIVRKRLGGARTATVRPADMLWEYNDGEADNFDMGDLWPDRVAAKPQLLHWANRCRNFVNQELGNEENFTTLGTNSNPLVILIQPLGQSGGMYIPGGYLTTAVASIVGAGYVIAGPKGALVGAAASSYLLISMTNKDGIYIAKDLETELNEDLMYHEFGHYLMWHLQGESWINPLEAGWADHSFRYNGENEKIAWTEGWAGGIGAIFDIAFRDDDGEAGWDGINNIERRLRFFNDFTFIIEPELDEWNVRIGNTPGQNIQRINTVTHGFVSEMNIVCAILDLYDGEGKGNILEPMAAEVFDDRENLNLPPGPGNLPQDLASFSFAQICRPLLNRQGSGLNSTNAIQNAVDYAYELARSLPCGEKHLVYDIWDLMQLETLKTLQLNLHLQML